MQPERGWGYNLNQGYDHGYDDHPDRYEQLDYNREPPVPYGQGAGYGMSPSYAQRDSSYAQRDPSGYPPQHGYDQPSFRYNDDYGEQIQSPGYDRERKRSLPRAYLPAYELPPLYKPPEQRGSDLDYITDMTSFCNRRITLSRAKPNDQLGFNIRGGSEHNCGVFVSKVLKDTDAYRLKLKEGDQILYVNGHSFLDVSQSEAIQKLKRDAQVDMIVKHFPFGKFTFSAESHIACHDKLPEKGKQH